MPTRRSRRTARAATAHFASLALALNSVAVAHHITPHLRRSWYIVRANQFGYRIVRLVLWVMLGLTILAPLAAYSEGRSMTQGESDCRDVIILICLIVGIGYRRSFQQLRAHRGSTFLTDTVILCATAHSARGEDRSVALEMISKRMRSVERVIRNARRVRLLSLPRFRRRAAAQHASVVVQCFRKIHPEIHRDDGDQAIKQLASLLMEIADRYAQGRVSALLPADQLHGLDPAKDYDAVRLAVAVLTFLATGVSSYVLGLQDIALPLATAAGAVVVLLLFGDRSQQLMDRFMSMVTAGL